MKLALVSNVLPPSPTAHAAIIYRLLRDVDPEHYCLISSTNYEDYQGREYSDRLRAKYIFLEPSIHEVSLAWGMRARLRLLADLQKRARQILRIIRKEKCDAIVVCTGGNEVLDFPAAYLASRLARVPFYAYLLDQYSHMLSYVIGNNFLRYLEPLALKGAAAVIVPNEFMQKQLHQRYRLNPILIRNACDLSAYEPDAGGEIAADTRGPQARRIVYTGGVGELHFSPFRTLLKALDDLSAKVTLHVYTSQPAAHLQYEGIVGPVTFHDHVPLRLVPAVQKEADILFLPLALDSPHHETITTAAPGKIAEYLAAGRPILVHAPSDSFVAWYFKKNKCGLVVDRKDPEELKLAILRLIEDRDLSRQLVSAAIECARRDFDARVARDRFLSTIKMKIQPGDVSDE
jgi:glycosyltransferase involved in cell wall biosynthesis